jgi:signal transduction histidine kinase
MRAEELFQDLADLLYVAIFVAVLARALRRWTRVHFDMLLFFGDAALIVVSSVILNLLAIRGGQVLQDAEAILLMALPYLLLRLVADFMDVPLWVTRGGAAGLAVSAVVLVYVPTPLPIFPTLLLVLYFVGLSLYASLAFWRGSRAARGVTRRRLEAVALGSVFIGLDILIAGLGAALPDLTPLWGMLGPLFGMASGLAYVLGFAPPTWLRRAWQEPELRAFLERAAALPHLPDTHAIVTELERGAASATGSAGASIGLLDERGVALVFQTQRDDIPPGYASPTPDRFARTAAGWRLDLSAESIGARVTREARATFVEDLAADDPVNAELYAERGARAAVAAPIVAGTTRLGVLISYAPRAPMFADSDIELVQLLADQASVVLESRKLLDAASQAQARAEATRLKEDFLSSAAHDLKTPITGILTQAQVLQRRLQREPSDPLVPAGITRIVGEARRLSALVLELLDVSLLEQGRLVSTRESVDLVELASAMCARYSRGSVSCRLEAPYPVVALLDPIRVRQLLEHLFDNAVKFSPAGSEVVVCISRDADQAQLEFIDAGIGIPPQDVPLIFDRFHRGSNVDDRRYAGLGLGLYLSRGIVEQHGGRIWVSSNPDAGSTVSVQLPIAAHASSGSTPLTLSQGVLDGG